MTTTCEAVPRGGPRCTQKATTTMDIKVGGQTLKRYYCAEHATAMLEALTKEPR